MNQMEAYWLNKLSGDLEKTGFPFDYKASVLAERVLKDVQFQFTQEMTEKLTSFCGNSHLNLYTALLSGVFLLIKKYSFSGEKDVVIGASVLKQDAGNEPVNTAVAIREKIRNEMSFQEVYDLIHQAIDEAYDNKDFPLDVLLERLNMLAFTEDFPLFDITVILENIHEKSYVHYIPVNFRFSFLLDNGVLKGEIQYNAALNKSTTVKRIIGHYLKLMQSSLTYLSANIEQMDILSREEKEQLLYGFNKTWAEYPKDRTLNQVLEEQVEKTPDNIALLFGRQMLSYRCLNEKANHVAHLLRGKGVQPDQFVGMMFDRSLEMIVAMLAILKSGGAYLPIDPQYPENRKEYMLKDSESQFLLTRGKYIEEVDFNGEIIDLDEHMLKGGNCENPVHVNSPLDLAYTIYTSGSTGKPKGVLIEHFSVLNLAFSQKQEFQITQDENILQFSSVCFDASVEQIYISLFSGATLVLIDKMDLLDMDKFGEFIASRSLTHIHAVPAFVGSLNVRKYDRLKRVIAGGDVCPMSLVQQWVRHNDFVNEYGPTETTVTSIQLMVKQTNHSLEEMSIGKALNNTLLYVLDKSEQPLPVGVPGELFIGGDGVARGYLNRPELTQERFTRDPFVKNGMMYRTGDLVRWLPEGNMEFLGRIDFQVKIRGFRIETGEIENRLLSQPDISNAVVIARDDRGGEQYLCAYLVAEKTLDMAAVNSFLSKDVPDYMVPSYFVQVDSIPLTPNGKVDRKALPAPDFTEKGADFVAPRNEIEEKLVDIWAELLHIEIEFISIDDNFFKLGGHSLKVAVLITLIHKSLDVKLKMSQIFEKPTIRQMAELVGGTEAVKYSSIKPAEPKEYYLQTSEQKRLYFFTKLEPDSILYNMPLIDIYHKNTDIVMLEEVLKQLIRRHESLRTSFHDVDGIAVQKIHDAEEVFANFEIEVYQTSEDGMIYSDQPGKEWTQVTGLPFQEVVEHFVRPFDLSVPPLLRVGLIKIWGDTQIFMMDQHHVASDGVSMVIIIDELWKLYDGKELPALKAQYKDYAEWTAKDEQRNLIGKMEVFWLDHFKGELPVLNLPADYSRPQRLSFEGDTMFFDIPKERTDQLNEMSKAQGQTLFMILFAAFNVLMAKLSGQEEIVSGTVTAGRNHADVQRIVGMFVNTLAIRNFPEGDKTFAGFLKEVQERTIAAFENQDYPLEQLVSKFASRGDRSRNPLFDVVFELENEDDREEFLLEALMMDPENPYHFKTNTSKFDMLLVAIETQAGMQFKIEYSTKLFKKETISRFVGYYNQIIRSVCEDSNQKIAKIDMVPDDERKKILFKFNDTKAPYQINKKIQELFVDQVARTPENVAVVFIDPENDIRERITYRALNRKSDQLAHRLRENGTCAGSIIAIMAKKSTKMIVGIMAILKAGGAYLPLNPDYPIERKKYIIADCQANILLTNFDDVGDLASQVIHLDDGGIYKGEDSFKRNCRNDQMAYIMYTSGSTGKPKGVIVDHRNVVRLVMNTNYLDFSQEHRILQTGALEFDASTFEIWGTLLHGSSFYLVPKDTILNAEKLKRTMIENRISTIWMTSALFNQMLDTDADLFSSLKFLLTGGDIVSPSHVKRLKKHVPDITVINCYGPTENTTFSTFHWVLKDYSDNIPIGKPIANSTVYILDKFYRAVPIGTGGELYVGGDGVASGYLNNPEMTHEKFFPDPFVILPESDNKKPMMYATGDLARWQPDGNIEFLGRIDFQVKIRGFRIEPGEIDNRLISIDFIDDAAVIARKNEVTGHHYLCAYFVSAQKVNISKLKELLLQDLPAYMIPSYFTQMEVLPLTSNGKVDRKALPEPNVEVSTEDYVPPETDTEKLLAEIWQEVLGVERISIEDNFFEIGGDSIKTILITSRLSKRQLSIRVNDIFDSPTIRKLANKVKKIDRTIDQGPVSGKVELTPIHKWFFGKDFDEKHYFNHFVMLHNEFGFDEKDVRKVFTKILEHHDALRMVYSGEGATVVQENLGLNNLNLYLEIIDLKGETDFMPQLEAAADRIQYSISLDTGPLLKLGLFRTPNGDYLLVVIHHNVIDGVSWRILLEDFEIGFRQLKEGKDIKFQEKTDSFKYWAAKLKEYAESSKVLEELDYWIAIENSNVEKLPRDFDLPVEKKILGNREIVLMKLEKEDTLKMIREANWTYNTEINDILLTALAMAIKEWSGNEKLLINMEGHGREGILEDINFSRTVGWYTSQYPVLLELTSTQEEDVEVWIRKTKETLRRIPHKGIGYGVLRYLTSADHRGNLEFKLKPEVSFNYLGQMGE